MREPTFVGYASPATIDYERTRFAAHCWRPFAKDIPLLYRHDRPAGKILELASTDQGLRVRALVTDDEAKRCSHFSVAAAIHAYQLRDVGDPEKFHGLVTAATLDDVSLTNSAANSAAVIMHRHRAAPVQKYCRSLNERTDLMINAVQIIQKKFELLCGIVLPAAQNAAPEPAPQPQPSAPRAAPMPRPRTEFSRLVEGMNRNEQRQHKKIRDRAWLLLSPDVAASAGMTLAQLQQFVGGTFHPAPEQLEALARTMRITS